MTKNKIRIGDRMKDTSNKTDQPELNELCKAQNLHCAYANKDGSCAFVRKDTVENDPKPCE